MSADQDKVFQDEDDQRQRIEPDQELDKKLAEMAIVRFLFLAERALTTAADLVAAKSALRVLGVKL